VHSTIAVKDHSSLAHHEKQSKKRGPKSKPNRITPAERYTLKKEKMTVLGLPHDSAVPMFAHKLSAEQIKEHSEINIWHAQREALERGKIRHSELLPQFQGMRGELKLYKGNKRPREEKELQSIDTRERVKMHRESRQAKMRELKLPRDSGIPTFAQYQSLQKIKDHAFINDWHQHREMIEKGEMKVDDLPLHLSNPLDGIKFKIKKKKNRPIVYDSKVTGVSREAARRQERHFKARQLGLNVNSALPVFAQRLTAEEIKYHKEIDNWHHHRSQMESGKLTEEELPAQFQTHRGEKGFKFRDKGARKAFTDDSRSKSKEKINQQTKDNQGTASHTGECLMMMPLHDV
jgi:hypothetical protein